MAAPRTILFTGKGGVGKTSVAAATARRIAAGGRRTLLLSTDPAHSLADVLDTPLGPEPRPVAERLDAQQVTAQDELERHWAAVQAWAGDLLVRRGVDRVAAEELSVPPGLDELFSLLELRRHHDEGHYDAIVVDCAPTGETLRLLSFPDVARWWLEKAFPQQRRMAAAARPFSGLVPREDVLDEVQRLVRALVDMNEILRDHEHVSVRLVMTPERIVVDESRRTATYLALYGFLTDAVVVNRVFPPDVDGYFAPWRARQAEQLEEVRGSFAPVPVLQAAHFPEEVIGAEHLDRLAAELYPAGVDAAAVLHDRILQELVVGAERAELRVELPFADRDDVQVTRVGLDVIVRIDGHKRAIALPPALADYRPAGAALRDGVLHVTFDRTAATRDA